LVVSPLHRLYRRALCTNTLCARLSSRFSITVNLRLFPTTPSSNKNSLLPSPFSSVSQDASLSSTLKTRTSVLVRSLLVTENYFPPSHSSFFSPEWANSLRLGSDRSRLRRSHAFAMYEGSISSSRRQEEIRGRFGNLR